MHSMELGQVFETLEDYGIQPADSLSGLRACVTRSLRSVLAAMARGQIPGHVSMAGADFGTAVPALQKILLASAADPACGQSCQPQASMLLSESWLASLHCTLPYAAAASMHQTEMLPSPWDLRHPAAHVVQLDALTQQHMRSKSARLLILQAVGAADAGAWSQAGQAMAEEAQQQAARQRAAATAKQKADKEQAAAAAKLKAAEEQAAAEAAFQQLLLEEAAEAADAAQQASKKAAKKARQKQRKQVRHVVEAI